MYQQSHPKVVIPKDIKSTLFGKQLRRTRTEFCEQKFRSGIEVGDKDCACHWICSSWSVFKCTSSHLFPNIQRS